MLIKRIVKLNEFDYSRFCSWLRNEQQTTIRILSEESWIEQDRMLTKFFIEDTERMQNESNKNTV